LPSETAHHLALNSLSLLKPKFLNNLVSKHYEGDLFGKLTRFGLVFKNPVGLAAGFDKDGIALDGLSALGFGFIEAGTVTLHPQPGNQRPRLFRLPKDMALINRAGFNNAGSAALAERVGKQGHRCIIGISIGKSRITPLERATEDYLRSLELVYEAADYIAVNVSSPNTEQLRELQQRDQLQRLLSALQRRNVELQKRHNKTSPLPLLVKLSPDLSLKDLQHIVEVVEEEHVDGIIATNTTVARPNLLTDAKEVTAIGEGGLSGLPLQSISTSVIAHLFRLTNGRVPLVGVGGIFTAEDAWQKICAGASLVQLYTGLIYQGPSIAKDINQGLRRILDREGFHHLDEAVGCRSTELVNTQALA
jgi:dihydroorotate dehydrogenase